MSPCVEKYLDEASLNEQPLAAESVFQLPQMVDKRQWLACAFMELLQLQRTGRVEPGIGDFRVTEGTLQTAGRVLCSIKYRHLPCPSLSTLSGGGVQITWNNGDDAIEVSVFPHGQVGVARLVGAVLAKAEELPAARYDKVNEFLADLVSG